MLCTALKPNGKFSGNFFELDTRDGINSFLAIYNFLYLYSSLHSLLVKSNLKLVSQELFERKLVVHFCFIIERSGSSVKGLINIVPDKRRLPDPKDEISFLAKKYVVNSKGEE